MDERKRNDRQSAAPTPRNQNRESSSAEDMLQDAPPGSGKLSSAPPRKGPADNPVIRSSQDVGDNLADEVREDQWASPEEKHDAERER